MGGVAGWPRRPKACRLNAYMRANYHGQLDAMNRRLYERTIKFKQYGKCRLFAFRGRIEFVDVGGEFVDLLSEEVDVALQFVVGRVITTSV